MVTAVQVIQIFMMEIVAENFVYVSSVRLACTICNARNQRNASFRVGLIPDPVRWCVVSRSFPKEMGAHRDFCESKVGIMDCPYLRRRQSTEHRPYPQLVYRKIGSYEKKPCARAHQTAPAPLPVEGASWVNSAFHAPQGATRSPR